MFMENCFVNYNDHFYTLRREGEGTSRAFFCLYFLFVILSQIISNKMNQHICVCVCVCSSKSFQNMRCFVLYSVSIINDNYLRTPSFILKKRMENIK